MKLRTLKSSLSVLGSTIKPAPTKSDLRMAGRALQDRRMRMWSRDPCCAKCGQLTDIAKGAAMGFELDHKVRLDQGGPDTDENCQVLCVWWQDGLKRGCHAEKTKSEGAPRP